MNIHQLLLSGTSRGRLNENSQKQDEKSANKPKDDTMNCTNYAFKFSKKDQFPHIQRVIFMLLIHFSPSLLLLQFVKPSINNPNVIMSD